MLPANAAAAFTAIMWTLGGDEATLGTSSASGQGRNCHHGHVLSSCAWKGEQPAYVVLVQPLWP